MPSEANKIDLIEFPAKGVEDIAKVKSFYGQVFQWSYKDWGDEYIDTSGSGLSSGFNADPGHRPSAPLAVIYVENLETARRNVIDAGGRVTREIFSFPGGRRFHFEDPIGNELAAWSDQ